MIFLRLDLDLNVGLIALIFFYSTRYRQCYVKNQSLIHNGYLVSYNMEGRMMA